MKTAQDRVSVYDPTEENLDIATKSYSNYLDNGKDVKFYPAIIQIEPTNKCNLSCQYCPHKTYSEHGFMEMNTYKKIIDETSETTKLYKLSFVGEPLLNQNIFEFIKYAKKSSEARVVLFTNGTALTRKNMLNIIESGLDEIVFSIDGATAQTIEKTRNGVNAEKLIRSVKEFVFFKHGRNPQITINYVCTELNKKEIPDAKDFWGNLNCAVHFSPLVDWSSQYDTPDLQCAGYGSAPNSSRALCADLWYKSVIRYNGDVVICCNDYASKYILGNANKDKLFDIWNNSTANNFRASHAQNNFDCGNCRECTSWTTRNELKQQIDNPLHTVASGARP